MTKVIFKIENDHVLAVFPSFAGTNRYWRDCTCYAHIGQHSVCEIDYARDLKHASKEQYEPLLKELVSLGYDDLKVSKRFTQKDFEDRKQQVAR